MIERTTRSVIIQHKLSPTFSIGLNTCFVVIWLLLLSVFAVSLSCFWKYINHSVNATCQSDSQTHLVIPTKEKNSCHLCSCTCCLFFSSGCCLPIPGLLAVFSFSSGVNTQRRHVPCNNLTTLTIYKSTSVSTFRWDSQITSEWHLIVNHTRNALTALPHPK